MIPLRAMNGTDVSLYIYIYMDIIYIYINIQVEEKHALDETCARIQWDRGEYVYK